MRLKKSSGYNMYRGGGRMYQEGGMASMQGGEISAKGSSSVDVNVFVAL